jgi:hypothetical protein
MARWFPVADGEDGGLCFSDEHVGDRDTSGGLDVELVNDVSVSP